MRRFYFSLLTALTLMTASSGCSHATKWHECGGSEPLYTVKSDLPAAGVGEVKVSEVSQK